MTKIFFDRIHNVTRQFATKLDGTLDILFRRKVKKSWIFVELFTIKYLYIFLTFIALKDLWYTGYGSYGIDFVWWKECIASLVYALVTIVFLLFEIRNEVVKILMHLIYVIYYIPLNSAFSLNNSSFSFLCWSNLYFLFLILAVYVLARFTEKKLKFLEHTGPDNNATTELYNNRYINWFCFIACSVYIIHKLSYNGLDFSLSIVGDDVYVNRSTYQEYLNEISGTLFSYILSIIRNIITYVMPFYILIAILRRKPIAFFTGCVCVLSAFSVASEKGKFLMPIVAIGLYILYRLKIIGNFRRVVNIGIIAMLVICLIEHYIFDADRIFTLFIRREMYYPAWLNKLYYDFFSQNPKILWTQNVFLFQNIFDPVYDVSMLELISNAFFRGAIPSPNTGLFAEAFMHFGIVGVFVYPLLLAALFIITGKVCKPYGKTVYTLLMIIFALKLSNVPITRTDFVLSHMLFVALLWILPKISFAGIANKIKKLINK